jgi:hypothetical protein
MCTHQPVGGTLFSVLCLIVTVITDICKRSLESHFVDLDGPGMETCC